MSVERRYECNLCRCRLTEGDAPDPTLVRKGVGIHFDADAVVFKLMRDTENHLCNACVEEIWAARQAQKTPREFGS